MITLFGKPEPTLLERLKESVSRTHNEFAAKVDEIFAGGKQIDPELLVQLERALLSADLGVRTTKEVLDAVREKVDRKALTDAAQLKAELKAQLLGILQATPSPNGAGETKPAVVFIVGVNGT